MLTLPDKPAAAAIDARRESVVFARREREREREREEAGRAAAGRGALAFAGAVVVFLFVVVDDWIRVGACVSWKERGREKDREREGERGRRRLALKRRATKREREPSRDCHQILILICARSFAPPSSPALLPHFLGDGSECPSLCAQRRGESKKAQSDAERERIGQMKKAKTPLLLRRPFSPLRQFRSLPAAWGALARQLAPPGTLTGDADSRPGDGSHRSDARSGGEKATMGMSKKGKRKNLES